jgi:DNA modification methylase
LDTPNVPIFINEFWTSRQRQAHSIHEISYRACFKPQLPKFFIELLTQKNDTVYDPFTGRGTTIIEAALLERNVISNDINPLSKILCKPRLNVPTISEIQQRLQSIESAAIEKEIDLSMFYHKQTLKEIVGLKKYLSTKEKNNAEDFIDSWIRMVATNRLTGHSKGFFSVYTLPPNQAVSPERQRKINTMRNQVPEYRDTKKIILKKSLQLQKDLSEDEITMLRTIGKNAKFISADADSTSEIRSNLVQLTVTSPPFLDIVHYANDNWLRCWFNEINTEEIQTRITMTRKIEDWNTKMNRVFTELFRITKPGGYVCFEVGEVRNGKIRLEEHVVSIGIENGFHCLAIMINQQSFTKTANIWGVNNNSRGTNSNRIVIFQK